MRHQAWAGRLFWPMLKDPDRLVNIGRQHEKLPSIIVAAVSAVSHELDAASRRLGPSK